MAATVIPQSRRLAISGIPSLKPISSCSSYHPSHIPSSLRHYAVLQSSEGGNRDGKDDIDGDTGSNVKRRSSNKTKRARTMAHLINDKPWSADLESSLSSLCPSPSKTTVCQTLRLIRTPSKALHFFNWTQQKGFIHDDQSYFMMVDILSRNRNLNAARNFLFSIEKKSGGAVKLQDKFFNCLIRGYGLAGLFRESVKVFLTMKFMGISPSVVTFNNLLSNLLKRGRTAMALKMYDEMLSTYGVTPDTCTFNILIRGFCMNSMVDEGFRFFKDMSLYKCEPDVVTYNTLVDGLCRAGKIKVAHNVMKGMLKKSSSLSPDVVTYTTLVRGYCAKQDATKALDVFREMVDRGLKPNRITYNTLIQGLCKAKELNKIKEILEGTVGNEEFVPDTCTFNTLINAHCNEGNLDGAFKVFDSMSELQVQLDSATYSVLIRSLCLQGDFMKAEELFDELAGKEILLNDVGCRPLAAAYNPMFEYLCTNGKTKKAERVFRQLMKRGTQDPSSYKTLIMGHCREGTFRAGYDLLVLMLRKDFVPDVETYESLIDGLLQNGEPILAHETLEKMLKSSHLPRTSTFHSVLAKLVEKGCSRKAASFITLMLERKIRQNINLSTDTVRLLLKSGLWDRAFEIVGILYENGYTVRIEELIVFLCKCKRLLEACQMLLLSLEKDQTVDIDICSTVITDLYKTHRASEAFDLYYQLLERGIQQPLICLEGLRNALEAEGRIEEAKFVAKKLLKQQQPERSVSDLNSTMRY